MNKMNIELDVLRIVACFMVVVLHSSAVNFYQFGENWWATNFYDSLVRCCVPLFIMISGAIFLLRKPEVISFYTKRIVRLLPPMLFWSMIYMLWNYNHNIEYGSVMNWLKTIVKGPVFFHLWYLYCVIGLYVFIPFLSKIYIYSTDLEKRIFIFIWFIVSSLLPTLQVVFNINPNFTLVYHLSNFSGFFGYLFLGAYLFELNQEKDISSKWIFLNFFYYVAFCSMIMLATYWYSTKMGNPNELFYSYLSPFVVISSAFSFNTVFSISFVFLKYSRALNLLSKLTLGIYCIHVLTLDRVQVWCGLFGGVDSPWWSIPATAAVTFVLSAIVVGILYIFKPMRVFL